MNRPIEQALENLLPRLSHTLPTVLIEQASSLFVQSRSKCSLKSEEEVARVYACAHLACERLKSQLNLPPIEPRPPIPPRSYDKLYTYLQNQLAPATPARKRIRSIPPTPLPDTKTRSSTLFSKVRPKEHQEQNFYQLPNVKKEASIPPWVRPTVRLLCKQMDTPKAITHVLAGIESILCLPRPTTLSTHSVDKSKLKLPAMIATVWFFVVAKMRGRQEKWRENVERKNMVRQFLEQAKENKTLVDRIGTSDEAWKGWEKITDKDVNSWRKEIIEGEWKEMDWWKNITEGIGVEATDGEDEEDGIQDNENSETQPPTHQNNFKPVKAMDRYDYLSRERRQEYADWKSKILANILERTAFEE